jgi:hypothetical protein
VKGFLENPLLRRFKSIWVVDSEYMHRPGNPVEAICVCGKELRSGAEFDLWFDETLGARPPYLLDDSSLFVAFTASAEFAFHLSWGWSLPRWVLDLHTEFKAINCGDERLRKENPNLLEALDFYKIDNLGAAAKEAGRKLAERGAPFIESEKQFTLTYCRSDVDAEVQLLARLAPFLRIRDALERGYFSKVAAVAEFTGIPLDQPLLDLLTANRPEIIGKLTRSVDASYGVYDGPVFKRDRFDSWLQSQGYTKWPRTRDGIPLLNRETFERMGLLYPEVKPLGHLRYTTSKIRSLKLTVGVDGRNRFAAMPFATVTGRNAPSTTKNIFGVSKWMRALIKPGPDRAILNADWVGQDYGTAAVLSGDPNLIEDYRSEDPYKSQASRLGLIDSNTTAEQADTWRDKFKVSGLSILYGLGARSLSGQLEITPEAASEILFSHRNIYREYWGWSDGLLHDAKQAGVLVTPFGWNRQLTVKEMQTDKNDFSLRNHMIQTTNAQMMRIGAIKVVESGLLLIAMIHDALVVEVAAKRVSEAKEQLQHLMAQTSAAVLNGFELRVDFKLAVYPDRYPPGKPVEMWDWVKGELDKISALQVA